MITVQGSYATIAFLTSQIDSHGGRLHSFRHFSNMVPIEVHRMRFTSLQLVLGVQK